MKMVQRHKRQSKSKGEVDNWVGNSGCRLDVNRGAGFQDVIHNLQEVNF
jgi:hypothetical protein